MTHWTAVSSGGVSRRTHKVQVGGLRARNDKLAHFVPMIDATDFLFKSRMTYEIVRGIEKVESGKSAKNSSMGGARSSDGGVPLMSNYFDSWIHCC